jgi:hypothetical protein
MDEEDLDDIAVACKALLLDLKEAGVQIERY